MKPEFIAAFIKSVQNVFSTMLQLPVEVGEPSVKTSTESSYDVSGIIQMSGDVTGAVVLSFPSEVAARLVSLFCGMELGPDSPDFSDAVGELVNMISGGAKAEFKGLSVSIGTPNVVIGAGHRVNNTSDTPAVVIPCTTDCGDIAIEVALRETSAAAAA